MLIGKLLTHELSIKQRGEEQVEKEDKRKKIALKASQEANDEESNEGSFDDDKISMLTKNFNRFLKRKFPSKSKHFNKKYEGEGKMKTKEVTCYECKKPSHIKSECPKLKFKKKEQRIRRRHSKLG